MILYIIYKVYQVLAVKKRIIHLRSGYHNQGKYEKHMLTMILRGYFFLVFNHTSISSVTKSFKYAVKKLIFNNLSYTYLKDQIYIVMGKDHYPFLEPIIYNDG